MARLLILPLTLIILFLAAFLIIRLINMIKLSKSKDIKLSKQLPYRGDVNELTGELLNALGSLTTLQFQSEIKINYKKISMIKTQKPEPIRSMIRSKSLEIKLTRFQDKAVAKYNNKTKEIPRENPWIDFWLGLSTFEELLDIFSKPGLKLIAGNSGFYQQRNYIELKAVSHLLPTDANRAYETCSPILGKAFGKNIIKPGITVRNFMLNILINGLTNLPDFIEIKYNLFDKDNNFICEYLENTMLTY